MFYLSLTTVTQASLEWPGYDESTRVQYLHRSGAEWRHQSTVVTAVVITLVCRTVLPGWRVSNAAFSAVYMCSHIMCIPVVVVNQDQFLRFAVHFPLIDCGQFIVMAWRMWLTQLLSSHSVLLFLSNRLPYIFRLQSNAAPIYMVLSAYC